MDSTRRTLLATGAAAEGVGTIALTIGAASVRATGGAGGAGGGAPGQCSTQMFDKYKLAGFTAVRDEIVANTVKVSGMTPSPIGDSFTNYLKNASMAEVDTFKKNLLDFLVMAYGGPNNYKGKDMKTAHTGLKITKEQYTAFLTQVVVPALTKVGVDGKDISDCFAPPVSSQTFIDTIVGQ
jgi:hypothetical protein